MHGLELLQQNSQVAPPLILAFSTRGVQKKFGAFVRFVPILMLSDLTMWHVFEDADKLHS